MSTGSFVINGVTILALNEEDAVAAYRTLIKNPEAVVESVRSTPGDKSISGLTVGTLRAALKDLPANLRVQLVTDADGLGQTCSDASEVEVEFDRTIPTAITIYDRSNS